MLAARLIGSLGTALAVLSLLIGSVAGAATRMYEGKWVSESFGNDTVDPTPAFPESRWFSILANPLGQRCHDANPVCPFDSSPAVTDGMGNVDFSIFGTICTPYTVFGPTRPARMATPTNGMGGRIPPFYRNPAFFTPGGNPYLRPRPNFTLVTTTSMGATNTFPAHPGCGATTTVNSGFANAYLPPFDPQRGVAQLGAPLTGMITANLTTPTGSTPPAFTFPAAASGSGGIRRTTLGSFSNTPPYLYSYTYRTLRNDAGNFFSGGGPGSDYDITFLGGGGKAIAKINVTPGPNQFGGTMKLLGIEDGRVCYFLGGGCSLGGADWKYRYAGASIQTSTPSPTTFPSITYMQPFTAMWTTPYYNTANGNTVMVNVEATRFPWTTGTVTVTAVGRGPHRTVEQRHGFDNRTSMGAGTIQLVTPLITRWLQSGANFETGGIAILRLPEPQKWMMLIAGLSLVGILYRARPR